jgi:carbon-monoxide dehydrogenase small subunit
VAIKSCTTLAVQVDGMEVTTIEGLATNGDLHPMQQAFWDQHGLQCGFCTPGMIMAAVKVAESDGPLTENQIRIGLEGNFCRCTGYQNIVKAVQAASEAMRSKVGA